MVNTNFKHKIKQIKKNKQQPKIEISAAFLIFTQSLPLFEQPMFTNIA